MPFRPVPSFSTYTVAYLLDRAWAMRARCEGCGHAKVWYAAGLAGFPPQATLAEIAPKLTCTSCGGTEGLVDVLNDTGEASRRSMQAYEAKVRGKG